MTAIEDRNDLKGWPILDQESLTQISQNLDFESDTVFYSSGDEPKQIPYSKADLQTLSENIAESLKQLGFSEEDRLMALGLDKGNHQSGTGLQKASEELGAETVVESIEEAYEKDLRELDPTAAVSLPRAMLKLGKDLEAEYGEELTESLPNVEKIATAGDKLFEKRRNQIEELWDADVGGFYVATEPGIIGVESEPEFYEPISDETYIEILEEGAEVDPGTGKVSEDKIHSLEDVEDEMRGSLIVSVPGREELPIIRYRLGDKITAKNGKIRYECREDEVINMSGHHIYPSDIEEGMSEIPNEDWYGVVSETEFETVLNIHVLGSEIDSEVIRESILEENEVISDWYDFGGVRIQPYAAEDWEELQDQFKDYDLEVNPLDGMKTRKIVSDESYTG